LHSVIDLGSKSVRRISAISSEKYVSTIMDLRL
jgi:hypothetical protein